ncbi:uncharacterized protein IWZ02DRAFT_285305 [Phyllosticta citriasiana]|uniref:uncharacterized protein n=1 Tax=Phyllosticta citriasiana TaxID=595635 RepID=UPI0030FD626D
MDGRMGRWMDVWDRAMSIRWLVPQGVGKVRSSRTRPWVTFPPHPRIKNWETTPDPAHGAASATADAIEMSRSSLHVTLPMGPTLAPPQSRHGVGKRGDSKPTSSPSPPSSAPPCPSNISVTTSRCQSTLQHHFGLPLLLFWPSLCILIHLFRTRLRFFMHESTNVSAYVKAITGRRHSAAVAPHILWQPHCHHHQPPR